MKKQERSISQTLASGFAITLGVTSIICITVIWFSSLISHSRDHTQFAQKETMGAMLATQKTAYWLLVLNQTEAGLNQKISQLYQKQLRNEANVTVFKTDSDPLQTFLDSDFPKEIVEQYPQGQAFLDQLSNHHQQILQTQRKMADDWRQSHQGLAELLHDVRRSTMYWTLQVANMLFIQSSIDELLYENPDDSPIMSMVQTAVFEEHLPTVPSLQTLVEKIKPLNDNLWKAANDVDYHIMMYEWETARKIYRDVFPSTTKSMAVYLDEIINEEEVIHSYQAEASRILNQELVPEIEATILEVLKLKGFINEILKNQQVVAENQTIEMESSWSSVEKAISWIKWIIIALTVLSGLFSFVFIRWIADKLIKPIKRLATKAKAISEGDLRTNGIPNDRKDEIGMLVTSINEMSGSLHHIVSQFSITMCDVASNAEKISTTSRQTAGGMFEQTRHVTNIHGKIEEITSLASEMEVRMEEVNYQSNQAESAARDGIMTVNTALEKMTSIQGVFKTTSAGIMDLKKSIDGIGQITKLIEAIALKSRLLAINAAIEAARAGKYGKGFTVIVEEIQSLANQTLTATNQVDQYVGELKLRTQHTVSRSNNGMDALLEGVELSKTAQESISDIITGSEKVSAMIQSVTQAVKNQTDRTREVASLVEEIAAISEQSNEFAKETVGIGLRLNEKSSDITTMLSEFRLNRETNDT